jgi:hypothetical protein
MPAAASEALFPLRPPVSGLRRVLFLFEPTRVRLADRVVSFLLRNRWVPRGLLRFFALLDLAWGEVLYAGEISSQTRMLQNRQRVLGNSFAAFGSVFDANGRSAFELIERTPATLRRTNAFVGQEAQPDLLAPHTFLFNDGPQHDRDKTVLIDRVITRLTPEDWAAADVMIAEWRRANPAAVTPAQVEPILVRALHRLLLRIEVNDEEVALALGWQRGFFSPLLFLPLGFRRALLKSGQRRLDEGRAKLVARYRTSPVVRDLFSGGGTFEGLTEDAFLHHMFEVMNLNGGAVLSNSQRIVRVLSERADLVDQLRAEHKSLGLDAPGPIALRALGQADKTRRTAMEVMRIYTRVTTISWRSTAEFEADVRGRKLRFPAGTLRTASIANANVDPSLYPEPYEIRMDRDYSRFAQFGGVEGPRRCPGRDPALMMIALLLVHLLREPKPS